MVGLFLREFVDFESFFPTLGALLLPAIVSGECRFERKRGRNVLEDTGSEHDQDLKAGLQVLLISGNASRSTTPLIMGAS